MKERMKYKTQYKAVLLDERFCSVIFDGTYQSAFGLFDFVGRPKDECGSALKICFLWLI